MARKRVGVFWDYENCRPPSNVPGFAVAGKLRQLIHHYGNITVFKAYMEYNSDNVHSRAMALQSELQSSGISMTNCPHNGRKDVADKMILVDMLAFAIDNPDSSTASVVLISGDRDFAYAVSVLRNRGYDVVLIVPVSCHLSLRVQATQVFEWREVFAPAPANASKEEKAVNKAENEAGTDESLGTQLQNEVPLKDRIAWLEDESAFPPLPSQPVGASNAPKTPTHGRTDSNVSAAPSSQRSQNRPQSRNRRAAPSSTPRSRRYRQQNTTSRVDESIETETTVSVTGTFGVNRVSIGPQNSMVLSTPTLVQAVSHEEPLFCGAISIGAPFTYVYDEGNGYDTDEYVDNDDGGDETVDDLYECLPSEDGVHVPDSRDSSMPTEAITPICGPVNDSTRTGDGQEPTLRQMQSTFGDPNSQENAIAHSWLNAAARLDSVFVRDSVPHKCTDNRYDDILYQSVGDRSEFHDARFTRSRRYEEEDFVPDYGDDSIDLERPTNNRFEIGQSPAVESNHEQDDEGDADMSESESSLQGDDEEFASANLHKGLGLAQTTVSNGIPSSDDGLSGNFVPFKLPLQDRLAEAPKSTLKPWVNPFTPYLSKQPLFNVDSDIVNNGISSLSIENGVSSSVSKPMASPPSTPGFQSSTTSTQIPTAASLVRFSTLISILRSHRDSTGDEFIKVGQLGAMLIKRDPNVYVREAAFAVAYEAPEDASPQQGSTLQARIASNRPLHAPIKMKEYIMRAQRAGIVILDSIEGWTSTGVAGIGLATGVAQRYEEMYGKRQAEAVSEDREAGQGFANGLGSNSAPGAVNGSARNGDDAELLGRGVGIGVGIGVVAHPTVDGVQSRSRDASESWSGSAQSTQETNTRLQIFPESRPASAQLFSLESTSHQSQFHQNTSNALARGDDQTGKFSTDTRFSSKTPSHSAGSSITASASSRVVTLFTRGDARRTSRTPTFTPLVSVLLQIHKPSHRVSRKELSIRLLKQFPDVYEIEGIQGDRQFRAYIDRAELAGVVRTGGAGTNGWVELVESWATLQ